MRVPSTIVLILLLVLVFMIAPLLPLLTLDSDAQRYFSTSLTEMVSSSFQSWGIYRQVAIVLKSLLIGPLVKLNIWREAQIVCCLLAQLIWIIAGCICLRVPKTRWPIVLLLVFASGLWIGTLLYLARALNQLIAASLAAAVLLYPRFEQLNCKKQSVVLCLYVFATILTYESHLLPTLAILAISGRVKLRSFISPAAIMAALAFAQMGGFLINNPKIISLQSSWGQGLYDIWPYMLTKTGQIYFTLRHIQWTDATFLIGSIVILFVFLCRLLNSSPQPTLSNSQRTWLLLASLVSITLLLLIVRDTSSGRLSWGVLLNCLVLIIIAVEDLGRRSRFCQICILLFACIWFATTSAAFSTFANSALSGNSHYIQQSVFSRFGF